MNVEKPTIVVVSGAAVVVAGGTVDVVGRIDTVQVRPFTSSAPAPFAQVANAEAACRIEAWSRVWLVK